jgi:hypothetical protein
MNSLIKTQLTLGVIAGCFDYHYQQHQDRIHKVQRFIILTTFWTVVIGMKISLESFKLMRYLIKSTLKYTSWQSLAMSFIAVPLLTLVGLTKASQALGEAVQPIVNQAGDKTIRVTDAQASLTCKLIQPYLEGERDDLLIKQVDEVLDSYFAGWQISKRGDELKGAALKATRTKFVKILAEV